MDSITDCNHMGNGNSVPVRFLAVADIHHSGMEGIDPTGCDAVLVAGDFLETSRYRTADALNGDSFFQWCKAHPDVPVFLIPGNHDHAVEDHEDWFEWPRNADRLHENKEPRLFKGVKIFGTPWTEWLHHGAFQEQEGKIPAKFAEIPDNLDILVAHATPKLEDTEGKADVRPGYGHVGSEALRDAILAKKPKVVVCGHVHADDHAVAKIGNTSVVNVSRILGSDRNGRAAFSPACIEFRADGTLGVEPARRI